MRRLAKSTEPEFFWEGLRVFGCRVIFAPSGHGFANAWGDVLQYRSTSNVYAGSVERRRGVRICGTPRRIVRPAEKRHCDGGAGDWGLGPRLFP